jgi:polysaccharide export outer membrane protein
MRGRPRLWQAAVCVLAAVSVVGCQHRNMPAPPPPADAPRELDKTTHPAYRVEPPDILLVEAYKGVPKPPHKVEPLDVLALQLADPLPNEPLNGQFSVDTDGTINLGPTYGNTVMLAGKTIPEAKAAIELHLSTAAKLKEPKVTVTLSQTRAVQRVSGTHLVRPDGTISLGSYGSVAVVGLTLPEVKRAIEAQLSQSLMDPEVLVEVQGFNSKLIYVVLDGGGAGQTVQRLPCTGNETVLDAIAQVNGLTAVSSTDEIWVARPAPAGSPPQILPVNWNAVVGCGETATNYQLLPGDRVYVASQRLVRIDTALARLLAPVERVFGIVLLGNSTVRAFGNQGLNGNNQ